MKRHGNLYEKIISIENLELADLKARKKKSHQRGIKAHDKNREANILKLHEVLKAEQFETSPYIYKTIYEPKEREISILPYYPDRIVQRAIMNVMQSIWYPTFTTDTYSCIPGRGTHKASYRLRETLQDIGGTTYCLKLDVQKYYQSVKHSILKAIILKKIKDDQLLKLLDNIITSHSGLAIGNYISQAFANLYLTPFDHFLKETIGVKYYFRYMDDMVILSEDKNYLQILLALITEYLQEELGLTVKGDYQVFSVAVRGVDFVGYPTFHKYALVRKRTKKNFIRAVKKGASRESIESYKGLLGHCDSHNLLKKYLPNG